jgi:hypothetical protein
MVIPSGRGLAVLERTESKFCFLELATLLYRVGYSVSRLLSLTRGGVIEYALWLYPWSKKRKLLFFFFGEETNLLQEEEGLTNFASAGRRGRVCIQFATSLVGAEGLVWDRSRNGKGRERLSKKCATETGGGHEVKAHLAQYIRRYVGTTCGMKKKKENVKSFLFLFNFFFCRVVDMTDCSSW